MCPTDIEDNICEQYKPLEFKILSYTGKWPNRCSGDLICELNKQEFILHNPFEPDGSMDARDGIIYDDNHLYAWSIDEDCEGIDQLTKDQKDQIREFISENCLAGHCGGCI